MREKLRFLRKKNKKNSLSVFFSVARRRRRPSSLVLSPLPPTNDASPVGAPRYLRGAPLSLFSRLRRRRHKCPVGGHNQRQGLLGRRADRPEFEILLRGGAAGSGVVSVLQQEHGQVSLV